MSLILGGIKQIDSVRSRMKSLWEATYWALLPLLVGMFVTSVFLRGWFGEFEKFHTLIEGSGALFGFVLVAFISAGLQYRRHPQYYVWVISGFLVMGVFDLAHALVDVGQAFVWLHSLATFFGGLLAGMVWSTDRACRWALRVELPLILLVAAGLFAAWSVLTPYKVPQMMEVGHFTLMAKVLNILGGIGFFAAWLFFYRLYRNSNNIDERFFCNHYLLFALAGMLFESSVLWDGEWWLWHVLRAMAYGLLLSHFLTLYSRDMASLVALRTKKEAAIKRPVERVNVADERDDEQR